MEYQIILNEVILNEGDLLEFFSLDEFRCKHCGCLPEHGMSEILLERLDKLRKDYGFPIMVSCGYRCPSHNAEVGGVYDSQHIYGKAADIWVNGDYEYFYRFVINSKLFDGVGYYPYDEFVHVDVRDDGESPNAYTF